MTTPDTGADAAAETANDATLAEPHVPDSASLPGADAGDGWNRLHPASPLLRGGVVFLAIVGIVIANLRDRLMSLFFGGWMGENLSTSEGDLVDMVLERNLVLIVLIAVVVLVILVVLGAWIGWRMHTYRISAEAVETRSGVLFRKHRRAPLRRIQGVNIQRPMIARLFGLATLQVTTAGSDGQVQLQYLSFAQAKELRQIILRTVAEARGERLPERAPAPAVTSNAQAAPFLVEEGSGLAVLADPASGAPIVLDPETAAPRAVDPARIRHATDPQTGQPLFRDPVSGAPVLAAAPSVLDERLSELVDPDLDPLLDSPASLVRVPTARLIASILLSWGFLISLGVFVGFLCVSIFGETLFLLAVVPFALIVVTTFWGSFTRGMRFSISKSPQGVRVSSGLLTTVTETLPAGRIHAVGIKQPLLWRPFGWWRVQVNVASIGQQNQQLMLPVGTAADAVTVFGLLTQGHGLSDEELLVCLAGGAREAFVSATPRARLVLNPGWKRTGIRLVGETETASNVLLRRGFFVRQLAMVPLVRVQSTQLRRTLLHRCTGLARLEPQTVLGVVGTAVRGLPLVAAREMHERIARAAVLAGEADRAGSGESS